MIWGNISLVAYQQCSIFAAVERCEDFGMHCSYLMRRGFCSSRNRRISSYMRSSCAATCEFCEGMCTVALLHRDQPSKNIAIVNVKRGKIPSFKTHRLVDYVMIE